MTYKLQISELKIIKPIKTILQFYNFSPDFKMLLGHLFLVHGTPVKNIFSYCVDYGKSI